ncbi:MAG: carboxypeptidase regulatory-like domain-containing protein [bacterium]|nr:carboxypeptidase regulatory-like domain-containing protein [bacterium]
MVRQATNIARQLANIILLFVGVIFIASFATAQCPNSTALSVPRLETFESGQGNWTSGGINNSWAFGTSAKMPPSTAGSAKSWVSGGLTGEYQNDEISHVDSPCYDLSGLTQPTLRMSLWRNSEGYFDGTALQASTDGGQTWNTIGNAGEGSHWYNNSEFNWWDDISTSWETVEYPLASLAGETSVRFRILFTSDFVATENGSAFDNFEIYQPPLHDLKAAAAEFGTVGQSGAYLCQNASLFYPTITIENPGANNESGFQLWYQIDGGAKVYEAFGGTISPLGSNTYTFSTGVDRSNPGAHTVNYGIELAGDLNNTNDSASTTLDIYAPLTSGLENFESGPGYWGSGGINSTWAFGTPAKASLSAAASGINAWVSGGLSGRYQANEHSYVESPCYDFSSISLPVIKMSLWRNSEEGFDGTILQASIDGGLTWTTIDHAGEGKNWYNNAYFNWWDGLSTSWETVEHPLPGLAGQANVSFRVFLSSDYTVTQEGPAFDNFEIYQPPAHDLGIKSATFGSQGDSGYALCQSATVFHPALTIENNGLNSETGFQVWYQLDGGAKVYEVFAGSIIPLGTGIHTFSSGLDRSSTGSHTISYGVELAGDLNAGNDEGSSSITVSPSIGAYLETFESGPAGWTSGGTNNSWAFGASTKQPASTAGSVNSWVSGGLSGSYHNYEISYVESPCYDFSSLPAPLVKMSLWRDSEGGLDGIVLQSSIDDGTTWTTIGEANSGKNWYNNNYTDSWDQVSNSWEAVEHSLPDLAGQATVRFRLYFTSDGSLTQGGPAFDNFEIYQPFVHDLRIADADLGNFNSTGASLCQSPDLYYPSLEFENVGLSSESGFQVWYQLDGGAKVYEAISGTLLQSSAATHTFSSGIDRSNPGSHSISYGVELAGDEDISNDSDNTALTVYAPLAPGLETFESGPGYWGSGGVNNTWDFGTPTKSAPNSAASGVNAWISGSLNGSYANNEMSYVDSPCFDLSSLTDPYVKLSLWQNTESYHDGMVLQSSTDDGQTWFIVGNYGSGINWYNRSSENWWDGSATSWRSSQHTISSLAGEANVRFRLLFSSDHVYNNPGSAFDDFEVFQPLLHDIGVVSGVVGSQTQSGNILCQDSGLYTPSLTIRNNGTSTESGFQVWYQVNSEPKVYEAFSGNLAPYASATHIFTSGFPHNSPASHTISYGVELTGDLNTANDSGSSSVTVQAAIIPSLETFESGAGGWTPGGTNKTWTLGTPAKSVLKTAASGSNAWVSGGLSGNYANYEDSYVESPCYDLSSMPLPHVKMSLWRDSEYNFDNIILQSSVDSGITWSTIGSYGTGINWYNNESHHWWDNTSTAWETVEHQLAGLAGQSGIKFRLRFHSDISGTRPGPAFDDFEVFQPPTHDLSISSALLGTEMASGTTLCQSDQTFYPSLIIDNYGLNNESGFQIWYRLDSGATITETFAGSISAFSSATHTFATGISRSAVGAHVVSYGVSLGTDAITANDSGTTAMSIAATRQFPYADDFESDLTAWSSGGTLSSWAVGNVAKNLISHASSGQNAWTTGGLGEGARNPSENSWVMSPCIDISSAINPAVSLSFQKALDSYDKMVMQYAVDDSDNWITIGYKDSSNNWYNQSDFWNGYSEIWLNTEHRLSALAGHHTLRFRFHLQGSTYNGPEGFAFDNFTFGESTTSLMTTQLDTSFGTDGVWVYPYSYPSDAQDLWAGSDGTLYVGGTINNNAGSSTKSSLWAVGNNGRIKTSFGYSGVRNYYGPYTHAYDIIVDSSGRIALAGYTEFSGKDAPTLWRYFESGNPDTSFNTYGYAATTFPGIEVEAFGMTEDTINGGYYMTGGQYHNYMALTKLNNNGSAVTSFNSTGKVTFSTIPTSRGSDVVVDSLGRVIVAGQGNPGAGDRDVIVWRYLADGSLDTSFNTTGYLTLDGGAGSPGTDDYAESLVIDSAGDIIVAGYSNNGTDNDAVVWKVLGSDGSLDTSWGDSGHLSFANLADASGTDAFHDIQLDNAGNIWLAGEGTNSAPNSDMCIVKLTPTGSLDNSFAASGIYCHNNAAGGNGHDRGYGIFIDSQNDIFVAGDSTGPNGAQASVWKIKTTTYTITGTVTVAGSPLPGVTIDGQQLGNQITDADGKYQFIYVPGGTNYRLAPAIADYEFTPKIISGTLNNNLIANFVGNASTATYSLSGHVYDNGISLAGITVDGGALGTQTTDSSGYYIFSNIPVGTQWNLSASAPKTVFAPQQASGVIIENTVQDFTAAIHNISLADVRVSGIYSPASDYCSYNFGPTTVDIDLFNWGYAEQTGFTVKYQVDGGPWVSEVFTDTIAPGDTYYFSFATPVDISTPGYHSITVDTSISPGGSAISTPSHTARTFTLPYGDNFENGSPDWVPDIWSNGAFAFGTPAKTAITGARSGVNAWVTDGLTPYTEQSAYTNEYSLLSPCFDLSSAVDPEFTMHIWWNSHINRDGAVIQVSTDDGDNWDNLGAPGSGENWYNSQSISNYPGEQSEGWSGQGASSSGDWVLARHLLSPYIGEPSVRFRLAYAGRPQANNDGVAFDDPMITERQSAPPSPDDLLDRSFADQGIYLYTPGTSYYTESASGNAVLLSPAGKIYVGGVDSSTSLTYSQAKIWALNDDGTLDTSFNSNGTNQLYGRGTSGNDLIFDSLGKLALTGPYSSNTQNPTIWRYLTTGPRDNTFSGDGIAQNNFPGLEVQSHGIAEDLINGGYFLSGGQNDNYMTLSKLTLAGNADASFSGDGQLEFKAIPRSIGYDVAVDSLGRVIVAGLSHPDGIDSDATVWRFLADGTLDAAFNGTGYLLLDGASGTPGNDDQGMALAIDGSDDIYLAGSSRNAAGNRDIAIWKISGADGSLDTGFNGTGIVAQNGGAGGNGDDYASDMLIDGSGNIWITGSSDNNAGNPDMCIWTLLTNGSLDTAFNKTGIFCHDGAAGGTIEHGNAIAIDSSNRILVTGDASDGLTARMTIWRLGITAKIHGTVIEQGSGLPVAGAIINIPGYGSTITDGAGDYEFRFLADGDSYTVSAASGGYTFTPPSYSGTASGEIIHDFVATPSATTFNISGTVTEAAAPVAGVTIDGGPLGIATTAGDGTYSFNNVPINTNYALVPSDQSTLFYPIQANGILAADTIHDFTILAAHHDATFTLGGKVTLAGTGLAGVLVSAGPLGTRTTDSNGDYSFAGLSANTNYGLSLAKAGHTFSPEYVNGSIFADTTQNFSAQAAQYTISGTITIGGQPLAATIINGGALGYTTTDASGNYQFSNVIHGTSYSLTALKTGYTFTPASFTGTAARDTVHNFTATQVLETLSGTVTENGQPVSGVIISGGAIGNRLTNASGQFSYSVSQGTVYNLSLTKTGLIIAPATASGTVIGNTALAFTASRTLHTISGTVLSNGSPLPGVSINAGALGSRTTDSSGSYSFTGIPLGTNYTITPNLSGHTFSPYQATGSLSGNMTHNFSATFGEVVDLGKSVTGQITLSNLARSPLSGVAVSAGGRSAITDNNGRYTLPLVPPGTHDITAELNGYAFSSNFSAVTIISNNLSGVDFSATPQISNPAYALWNGFLGMINILEVMNTGDTPLRVSLTLYTIGGTGNPISKTWTIPVMTQRDIILNDLQGFEKDTYGMFRVECSHNSFDGRVSVYYPDSSGTQDAQYGFAYNEPLRNVINGPSAVMYNTYHPGTNMLDSSNTVYNWLTIANLDEAHYKGFTVKRYNMSGEPVLTQHISVPPLGRLDIDGGHINPGPNNVGTNRIIPDDSDSPYLANLVRYAEGSNFNSFDYAMTLPAENGFADSAYLPMSVEFAATNFIEVANILNEPVDMMFTYTDSDGYIVGRNTVRFPPMAQRHFPTSGMLLDVQSGFVKIQSSKPQALLAQSVFYHQNQEHGSIDTAYAAPAREIFGQDIFTTYNTYINMKNYLRLINISAESSLLTYSFPEGGSGSIYATKTTDILLPKWSGVTLNLHTPLGKNNTDSYGLIHIETNIPGSISAELIRYRELANRKIEFAVDSPAR